MAGLARKYLWRWKESLAHNLASLAHRDEVDEASAWNAGIAATALGDWAAARRAWATAGLQLPGGEGPIDGDFSVCSVRLNPSGNGETVFADGIDVVRARIANIPLPESGFAFGDIVLHDGAATGAQPMALRCDTPSVAPRPLVRTENRFGALWYRHWDLDCSTSDVRRQLRGHA